MRRLIVAVVALVCVGLLSSCSLLPPSLTGGTAGSVEQQAALQMQHIANAAKSHDKSALKKLFSARAREKATDLDDGLAYFLSAFPAGPVTWKTQGTGDLGDNVFLKHATELFGHYDVSAGGEHYDLYFAYISVNDFDPDEVGIYALGIAPHEADPYTPSGKRKPFPLWAGQFGIDAKKHVAVGDPGVYVPSN